MPPRLGLFLVLATTGLIAVGVVVLLRRVRQSGWRGEVIVRCGAGHLFTTVWVPGISVKAVRLGIVRFQYCPVGDHLTFVVPVPPDRLTDSQRRLAARYRDSNVP